ncbi:MAG: hypothetical protein AAGN35_21135 [Bacteroidota bacterium]
MPDKLHKTLKREVDFAQKITPQEGEEFILHIEFQTSNHPKMIYRMQLYHAMLAEKYQLPVVQAVLYVGARKSTMRSQLRPEEIMSGFQLIDLPMIDFEVLLASEIPEEVILAILSNHGREAPKQVARRILQRLRSLESDRNELSRLAEQLITLSRIRKLEYIFTEELKAMPFTIDIEKDALYQKGNEKGFERGQQKNQREVARKMLRLKQYPIEEIVSLSGLTEAEVMHLQENVED